MMDTTTANDLLYMRRAMDLAQNGAGKVSPNPLVGAVIVYEGKIIGEGWHDQYGGPHAEVNAVRSVHDKTLLPKSTLYCTLEPCFHFGKTPPCVDLVLEYGIGRVVVGIQDINPLVAGKSLKKLEDHGVEVKIGLLKVDLTQLNRTFIHWITRKQERPYILLKWAQSKDGYLGRPQERTSISGPVTRRLVHRWRNNYDAILVGTQTAFIDNPQLDTRYFPGNAPLRIALDRNGILPLTHHLLDDQSLTWIIGTPREGTWQQTRFLQFPGKDLIDGLLQSLVQEKKATLLVEGGGHLLQAFIQQGYYDEIKVITAPVLLKTGVAAPAVPNTYHNSDHFNLSGDSIDTYLY